MRLNRPVLAATAALLTISAAACSGTGATTTAPASSTTSTAPRASGSASSAPAASTAAPSASKVASSAAAKPGSAPSGKAVKAANKAPDKVGEYKAEQLPGDAGADYSAPGKKNIGVFYNKSFPYERAASELDGAQPLGELGTCGESKASPGEYMCIVKLDDGGIMRLGAYKGATLAELQAFAAEYVATAGTV